MERCGCLSVHVVEIGEKSFNFIGTNGSNPKPKPSLYKNNSTKITYPKIAKKSLIQKWSELMAKTNAQINEQNKVNRRGLHNSSYHTQPCLLQSWVQGNSSKIVGFSGLFIVIDISSTTVYDISV